MHEKVQYIIADDVWAARTDDQMFDVAVEIDIAGNRYWLSLLLEELSVI
jgi:hypothetical protein